jgi:hypothetical protein
LSLTKKEYVMSNENILEEVVGLTPRISCLEDGTETLSLIIASLTKYKPLALMDKTEKENLDFLETHLVNQFGFLLEFCQNSVVSSKAIHVALKTTLEQESNKLDAFLNVCKKLSKEGKVIDTQNLRELKLSYFCKLIQIPQHS